MTATARCTDSSPPDGSTSLASTSTSDPACPNRVTVSGTATGASGGFSGARTSTRIWPVEVSDVPYAAW